MRGICIAAIRRKVYNFPRFPQDQYEHMRGWRLVSKQAPWSSGHLGSPLILPFLISGP